MVQNIGEGPLAYDFKILVQVDILAISSSPVITPIFFPVRSTGAVTASTLMINQTNKRLTLTRQCISESDWSVELVGLFINGQETSPISNVYILCFIPFNFLLIVLEIYLLTIYVFPGGSDGKESTFIELNAIQIQMDNNLGFPGGSDSKESVCDAGELGSIPGSERKNHYSKSYIYWVKQEKVCPKWANAGNVVSIPRLGRSPGKENGNPLQYSCLGNPMNRGVWQATAHGASKSQT